MNTPTTQWIQNRSIKMNKHNACTLRALDWNKSLLVAGPNSKMTDVPKKILEAWAAQGFWLLLTPVGVKITMYFLSGWVLFSVYYPFTMPFTIYEREMEFHFMRNKLLPIQISR